MKTSRRSLLKNSAAAAATLSISGRLASAQAEAIRIGVVYDLSGPFAAGGSAACAAGAQIAIDLVNERGGVAGKHCNFRKKSISMRSRSCFGFSG